LLFTDPWLKRAKKRKEKTAKEKKLLKTKKTARRQKVKSNNADDDSDEFDNIDRECDRALEEARKKAVAASLSKPSVVNK